MDTPSAAVRLFAAALMTVTLAGCDDGVRGSFVAGGVTEPSPLVSAFIDPSAIPFETAPFFAGCPIAAPFRSTFALLIDLRGGADVILDQVSFRFVDFSGMTSMLFFSHNDLTTMFGIPSIAAGTSRRFTFHPNFGCGFVSTPRTLTAELVFEDRAGRRQSRMLNAAMR